MQTEVLIIGQGISGTLLSWFLEQRNCPYLVVDDAAPNTASRIASGVMNPVSGRMREKAWMIDEIIPYAVQLYKEIGTRLGVELVAQKDILDFFPSPQMRLSFTEQEAAGNPFLQWPDASENFDAYLHHSFGFGKITPCYTVQMGLLLSLWRNFLSDSGKLIEQKIETDDADIKKTIAGKYGIHARKIIFCDGAASAVQPLFQLLPFALNKGESLTVRIPGLPTSHILKRTMSLVPIENGFFKWGASYTWHATDAQPTTAFRQQAETQLRNWLKIPFTVEQHEAAFRPATVERRPFAGFHPLSPDIGILNGMGSKGASLAPWFAQHLAALICEGTPIHPEADINRFKKILSR
jgi:glycine/D-amino acid oxidase-like deaminating enzyme